MEMESETPSKVYPTVKGEKFKRIHTAVVDLLKLAQMYKGYGFGPYIREMMLKARNYDFSPSRLYNVQILFYTSEDAKKFVKARYGKQCDAEKADFSRPVGIKVGDIFGSPLFSYFICVSKRIVTELQVDEIMWMSDINTPRCEEGCIGDLINSVKEKRARLNYTPDTTRRGMKICPVCNAYLRHMLESDWTILYPDGKEIPREAYCTEDGEYKCVCKPAQI